MLRQALILSSQREYAQTMRQGLLRLDAEMKVAVETDPLRAMQLSPQQYDLVLLDTLLDAMDGLQMLQFIKNQAPAGKFIVVSDTGDEAARALAYQNGADFFPRATAHARGFGIGPRRHPRALQASRGAGPRAGTTRGIRW